MHPNRGGKSRNYWPTKCYIKDNFGNFPTLLNFNGFWRHIKFKSPKTSSARFHDWKSETALWAGAKGPIRICALKKRQVLIRVMKGGGRMGKWRPIGPSIQIPSKMLLSETPFLQQQFLCKVHKARRLERVECLLLTNWSIHPYPSKSLPSNCS